MTGQSVVALLEALQKQGAHPCVGGGWGVDALLGQQTRDHSDLDLWLPANEFAQLIVIFAARGIDRILPWGDDRPWNLVLHDGAARRVDLHLYESLPDESIHYGSVTDAYIFPAAALEGRGASAAHRSAAKLRSGLCAGTPAIQSETSTVTTSPGSVQRSGSRSQRPTAERELPAYRLRPRPQCKIPTK